MYGFIHVYFGQNMFLDINDSCLNFKHQQSKKKTLRLKFSKAHNVLSFSKKVLLDLNILILKSEVNE